MTGFVEDEGLQQLVRWLRITGDDAVSEHLSPTVAAAVYHPPTNFYPILFMPEMYCKCGRRGHKKSRDNLFVCDAFYRTGRCWS